MRDHARADREQAAGHQPGTLDQLAVVDTAILGLLCQASGIATKAARCKKAAGARQVIAVDNSAAMLKAKFAAAGLPAMPSVTHIVPLLIGCPVKAKKISDILLAEYGLYVQPINFPTVPRGTERLRFTPGPQHGADMMDELVGALVEIWGREDIRLAA